MNHIWINAITRNLLSETSYYVQIYRIFVAFQRQHMMISTWAHSIQSILNRFHMHMMQHLNINLIWHVNKSKSFLFFWTNYWKKYILMLWSLQNLSTRVSCDYLPPTHLLNSSELKIATCLAINAFSIPMSICTWKGEMHSLIALRKFW